jgi:hypothetical protein
VGALQCPEGPPFEDGAVLQDKKGLIAHLLLSRPP